MGGVELIPYVKPIPNKSDLGGAEEVKEKKAKKWFLNIN